MKKKEDLRIRKTKKNLYEGLLKLLKDTTFETIKVSDICNAAMVNRSTFYDHFDDKYDLLNALLNDLQTEFRKSIKSIDEVDSAKDYYLIIVRELLNHVNSIYDIYCTIVKKNYNSVAFDMLKTVVNNDVVEVLGKYWTEEESIPLNIFVAFYVPAVISVCFEYLTNPNKYKEEEILFYLSELFCYQDYKKIRN